nr:hypothetical protein [Thermobacillus composti]
MMQSSTRPGDKLAAWVIYLILIVTAIAVIYPLYWVVLGALNGADAGPLPRIVQ